MQKVEQQTDGKAVSISPEFLGIKEVSQYLGVQTSTLYSWTREKKIPYYKIERLVKFKKSEIDKWIGTKRVACKGANACNEETVRPRLQKRPSTDIDRFVGKSIEEILGNRYNRHQGKPDRVKGSRKEGSHGTL